MARERHRNITKDDVRFVYENYAEMTNKEMADKLGLSVFQINKIITGLRKRGVDLPKRRRTNNVFDEFVSELTAQATAQVQ